MDRTGSAPADSVGLILGLGSPDHHSPSAGIPERVALITRDYGNGLRESTVLRVAYPERADGSPPCRRPAPEAFLYELPDPGQAEIEGIEANPLHRPIFTVSEAERLARREVAQASSAARSRRTLRRQACAGSLSRIGTLTYRALMEDRDTVIRNVKEWCRRMARVLPGFTARTVLELQKRGALHAHLLHRPLPTWVVARDPASGVSGLVRTNKYAAAMWDRISGGGNFDSGEYTRDKEGRRHRRAPSRDPLTAIKYACKYVGKCLADDGVLGKRRFLRFGQVAPPVVNRWSFRVDQFARAQTMAREFHGSPLRFDRFGDEVLGVDWSLSYSPPD